MEKILTSEPQEGVATIEKNFDALVNDIEKLSFIFRTTGSFTDWDDFRQEWESKSYDYEQCQGLLAARKNWVEMMRYGEEFQHFFEEKITEEAHKRQVGGDLYEMVRTYAALNFKNGASFMNTLLDTDTVWNYEDGSTAHSILDFLGNNGDEKTSQVLVRHIQNIYREDYVRAQHRDGDTLYALAALSHLVGKESTMELLNPLITAENPLLTAFFVQNPDVLSRPFYGERRNEKSGQANSEINFDLEHQRIKELETELEEIRVNPRVPPRRQQGSGGRMSFFEDDWFEDENTMNDRGSLFPNSQEGQTFIADPKAREYIDMVNEMVLDEKTIAPTAASAIQLHMFNFVSRKPDATEDEIQDEFKKINRLSEREAKYSEVKNPLPTIGIEIEVPDEFLTPGKIAVLNAFGIKNYREALDDLWEVNPDFSYSAGVQARLIQELGHLGALPIDSRGKIDQRTPLSLHVNFGMPVIPGEAHSSSYYEKYREKMHLLKDLIVYGFTSPDRLRNRKTGTSLKLEGNASRSKKDKGGVEDEPEEKPENISSSSSNFVRMELRATEFKDYPTFRMLSESQRLVAMLISHIKYSQGIEMTFVEACLADLWTEFETEVKGYFAKEGLESNLVDHDPFDAVNTLRETDLKMWSRFLISDYSRKANEIIEEATPLS
jgi:hypothetical protein